MISKKIIAVTLSAGVSALAFSNINVQADTANYIETNVTSGTTGVTYGGSGSYPVITAILSQPGTVDGNTYTNYAMLANDGTGSIEVYGTLSGLGYTPTVGDAISVTGKYSPYDSIPELETITSITQETSGNTVPTIGVATIPELNVSTLPENIAGYEFTVNNVTISGISGTFGTTNLTGTITDTSGNNMPLYYWESSYSSSLANLDNMTIPTGPVDLTGFVSVYSGNAQFVPISITAVPEPAPLALCALGGLAMLTLGRKRRKA